MLQTNRAVQSSLCTQKNKNKINKNFQLSFNQYPQKLHEEQNKHMEFIFQF